MIKLKPYRQKKAGFCGPTCLKMVNKFYGVDVSDEELDKITGAAFYQKISTDKMIEAAKSFGFNVFAKDNATLEDIERFITENKPVIVRWFLGDVEPDGHYSVIIDIDKENIVMLDPLWGKKRKMTLNNFLKVWFDYKGEYLEKPEDIINRWLMVLSK